MNKKKQIISFALIVVIVLSVSAVVVSGYDSSSDPLVSLSYLTDIFKPELKGEFTKTTDALNTKTEQLNSEIERLNQEIESLKSQINSLSKTVASQAELIEQSDYKILELHQGDIIYVTTSSDIVLRSGTAVVISPFPTQGLNDYTVGTELYDGDRVIIGHYVLIPRGNDGRGIRITSSVAYVMVRGGVNVTKAE